MKTTLREIDRSNYPELSRYSKDDIWRDMGPGGLYLVSLAAESLCLRPNAWVLDLGCGSAESSLFLAENYQVNVIAADLWRDPSENANRIENRGQRDKVIPLKLDASEPMPFAEEYFDAILCLNNLNFYGTDIRVVDQIARHLNKGGIFCSAGECLSEEFTPEQLADPPEVYNFEQQVWENDFLTSHSPRWWADHVSQSSELELLSCQELADSRRFFEEQALLSEPEGYFGLSARQSRELEIRQIEFGRKNRPAMTIYQLIARRR